VTGADVAASGKWNDLAVRTASAVVLAPIVIVLAWAGGWWFAALVAVMGVLLASEWVRLVYGPENLLQLSLYCVAVVAGVLFMQLGQAWPAWGAIALCWVISIASGSLKGNASRASWIGVPYVTLPVMALAIVRSDAAYGLSALIWLLLLVWSADSIAYVVGRLVGGPKLAPKISPGKTWSGLGGAILGGALASLAVGYALEVSSLAILALLGGVLAVVAQTGDLFESHLKRRAGVKDSGKVIPGHGGIFDRVDGLVAVAIAALIIGVTRSEGTANIAAQLLNW